MKKLLTILSTVMFTVNLWAQSPEKMSYQAVLRNSSNALVKNTMVGMRISILSGSPTGTAAYVETHNPSTNENGLVSLAIGAGTVVSGNLATIDWGNGTYFIKTETDIGGGVNYSITGSSQLLSVPYALYANKAKEVILSDAQKLELKGEKGDPGASGISPTSQMGYGWYTYALGANSSAAYTSFTDSLVGATLSNISDGTAGSTDAGLGFNLGNNGFPVNLSRYKKVVFRGDFTSSSISLGITFDGQGGAGCSTAGLALPVGNNIQWTVNLSSFTNCWGGVTTFDPTLATQLNFNNQTANSIINIKIRSVQFQL